MFKVLAAGAALLALEKLSRERTNGRRDLRRAIPEWYHVAYRDQLDSIAKEGLGLGGGSYRTWGAYVDYVEGKIFLTPQEGVAYWADQKANYAEHVGVRNIAVLRVLRPLTPAALDLWGSYTALGPAAWIDTKIPNWELALWTGKRWRALTPEAARATMDAEPSEYLARMQPSYSSGPLEVARWSNRAKFFYEAQEARSRWGFL